MMVLRITNTANCWDIFLSHTRTSLLITETTNARSNQLILVPLFESLTCRTEPNRIKPIQTLLEMSLPWTERIRFGLHNMQRKLAFHGWEAYPQYSHSNGIGRSALISTFLGILWGIHALLGLQCVLALAMIDTSSGSTSTSTSTTISPLGLLAPDRLQLLLQWSLYVVALTTFHLAEFFVTSLHNPTVATSDSFLVNHSVHYTLAALVRVLPCRVVPQCNGPHI